MSDEEQDLAVDEIMNTAPCVRVFMSVGGYIEIPVASLENGEELLKNPAAAAEAVMKQIKDGKSVMLDMVHIVVNPDLVTHVGATWVI